MMLEFALLGVVVIFLTMSVFEGSLMMWQYHTLAEAVQVGARYISAHGVDCTENGNSCTITVGNVASYIAQQAVGLNPAVLNVTLTSASGSVPCDPLNSCNTSTTVFPPSSDNAVGSNVKVTATYTMNNPIVMFWPGVSTKSIGSLTLGATSTQRIMF